MNKEVNVRVDVYRNLNRKCFSIRSRERDSYGLVVGHAETVAVRNATFIVQPAGREKVLKTGIKNVHAFVRGDLIENESPESAWHSAPKGDWNCSIFYNPRCYDSFVGKRGCGFYCAKSASMVLMTEGREIKAKDVG